jgi:ferritin-like metal-binding protein YciE
MSVATWLTQASNRQMRLENFDDLLVEQLKELHAAETQLLSALDQLKQAAHAGDLKQAFDQHRQETEIHRQRLDDAFRELHRPVESELSEAMKGLLAEGEEVMGLAGDPHVKDSALVAAAQRIEHYEIACYTSARAFADHQGHASVVGLLERTLEEETRADETLTKLANSVLTPGVAHRT